MKHEISQRHFSVALVNMETGIDYLREEMGSAVDVMIAVKRALDPHDILNPGKLFEQK